MKEICSSIGIMGGTFDPVHNGHLIIAEEVREKLKLDSILFIPSGHPPHKDKLKIASAEHRLNMIKCAIGSNSAFCVSEMEIEREGYTYTVDTLQQLKSLYGDSTKLFFIIGADVVRDLVNWRDFKKVFTLCEFAAVMRPGFEKETYRNQIRRLTSEYMAKIHNVDVPVIDISSTYIREKLAKGESIKYLVPESVEEYIKRNGLYK
ncbi:MAG: nicotinate-nucleotide adenylyltransferase [Clostridia bacterium]|nr:nicotinate-nucleotide adenylyltransferase [Clostridia bacterium]